MKKIKVVVYVRVSTYKQANNTSIEKQIEVISICWINKYIKLVVIT